MMATNIVRAIVPAGATAATADSVHMFDHGQVLAIGGINAPDATLITYQYGTLSVTRMGTLVDGVLIAAIPNELLQRDEKIDYHVTAYVYVETDDAGQTEYTITIPVRYRVKPDQPDISDDEKTLIDEAIEAINTAAREAEQEAINAAAAADRAETAADGITAYIDGAIEHIDNAADAADQDAANAAAAAERAEVAADRTDAAAEQAIAQITETAAAVADDAAAAAADASRAEKAADDVDEKIATATAKINAAVQRADNDASSATNSASRANSAATHADAAVQSAIDKINTFESTVDESVRDYLVENPPEKGDTGDSAYECAVKEGYSGTESEWLESLIGPRGPQGIQGETGNTGFAPTVTVTPITDGHIVTITDINGEHVINVMNGECVNIDTALDDASGHPVANSVVTMAKADVITDTATGTRIEIPDGAPYPIVGAKIKIVSTQAGDGDPSPSNVRPIAGKTSLGVYVSPTDDAAQATLYTVHIPTAAGTVYGGTYDTETDTVTITDAIVCVADLNWGYSGNSRFYNTTAIDIAEPTTSAERNTGMLSNIYKLSSTISFSDAQDDMSILRGSGFLRIKDSRYTDVTLFKQGGADTYVVYPLAHPITVSGTNLTQTIRTALGENHIWAADNEELTITYRCDTALFVKKNEGDGGGGGETDWSLISTLLEKSGAFSEPLDLSETDIVDLVDYRLYKLDAPAVIFPATLQSLGQYALATSNIRAAALSENTSTIGNYAFQGCAYLTTVSNTDAVTTIGDGAFQSCENIDNLSFPAVTTIGNNAFFSCSKMHSISLPDAAITITGGAFRNTGLTNIDLKHGWTFISNNAYSGCNSLRWAKIRTATTQAMFSGCGRLTSVWISTECPSIYHATSRPFLSFWNTGLTDIYMEYSDLPDGWKETDFSTETNRIPTIHYGVPEDEYDAIIEEAAG